MAAILSSTIVKSVSHPNEYYKVTSETSEGRIDATGKDGVRHIFHEYEVTIVSDPEELQEVESKFNPSC